MGLTFNIVMPGLVPGIHVLASDETWMAGSSPAMTKERQETASDER
jgi:hypothetical protein